MIPIKGKNILLCRACDYEYKFTSKDEYKIIKKIQHSESEKAPIVVEKSEMHKKISEDDRKAFEEFFGKMENPTY